MTSFPRTRRHSVDAEALGTIELHWRVGARGALTATVHVDAADRVSLDATLHTRPGLREESARHSFSGTMAESDGERLIVVRPISSATLAESECSIALVRLADDETAVITDLPERLGLRGGTYALERITIR